MSKLPSLAALVFLTTVLIPPPGVWVQRSALTMGTELVIATRATDRERGFQAIDAALQSVRRLEAILSDWQAGSEISRLNHSDVVTVAPMSRELTPLLARAVEWSRMTDGAFDPGLGALVDAWGFRGSGRVPGPAALAAARLHSGILKFTIDTMAGTFQRPDSGSWIDTGAFGKGAGLSEAREALKSRGVTTGILNFGGQVLVFGDTTVTIGVARPDQRTVETMHLRLRNGSAATSAQSEHYIEVAGRRFGHILDPRSGMPVSPWGSVTVVHPDPMVADILSTALFVMGPEAGMRWLKGRDIAALFLVVQHDGIQAQWTPALEPLISKSTGSGGD